MAKYCSDCEFLQLKDKKKDGIYKCAFCKKYVNTTNNQCENFSETYSRNWYEKQKIYDEGKNVSENDISLVPYVVLLIILSIIYLVAKLNGY